MIKKQQSPAFLSWASIKESGFSIVIALLVAVCLRSFVYESYYIPSGSMKPGLLEGDFILVAKYPYGYSRHSLPFSLPLIPGRIAVHEMPKRGEVLVFRHNGVNYIKRLIGLPGDTIEMRHGILYINQHLVPRKYVGIYQDEGGQKLHEYIENLREDIAYPILDMDTKQAFDNVGPFHVPEGHFFMMGDNRDYSLDSRATAGFGYVSFEQVVGRADFVVLSSRTSLLKFWRWLDDVRFERCFRSLHIQSPAHP